MAREDETMRLVPVKPTEAMLAAGQAAGDYGDALKKAYRAMLAAAPAPATARGGDALSRWIATAETPFAEGGLGDDLYKRGTAYLADYVLSTEGADHEPSEFERVLLEDAFAGLMGDEALFGPIRTVLAALASQPQATGGAVEREAVARLQNEVDLCGPHGRIAAVLADDLRTILAAIATQPAPSPGGWQDISTAPKDGTVILTYGSLHNDGAPYGIGETPTVKISQYSREGDFWCCDAWGSHEPVWWQPLPAAPSIQKGDEG